MINVKYLIGLLFILTLVGCIQSRGVDNKYVELQQQSFAVGYRAGCLSSCEDTFVLLMPYLNETEYPLKGWFDDCRAICDRLEQENGYDIVLTGEIDEQ